MSVVRNLLDLYHIVSQCNSERKYSTLENEMLAVISGVKKFHPYLYGLKFSIKKDHKPLEGLFGEKRRVSNEAAPCIQRWALTLTGYEHTISYKAVKTNGNADALSRLPLPVFNEIVPEVG